MRLLGIWHTILMTITIRAHNFYNHGTLPEQYAQYSYNFNPHMTFNLTHLYKREVLDITQDGAYMGIWQIFQPAYIAKRPICSVHPHIGNPNVREDLHRTVYCIDGTYNQHSKLYLMWTPMQVNTKQTMSFCAIAKSGKQFRYIKYT